MSIDKIIQRLQWFLDYNEEDFCGGDRIIEGSKTFYYVSDEDLKAFKEAIELIKENSCEDSISRQAAQEGLNHLMDSDGFRDSVGYVQKSLVRKMLDNLPYVQPKQTECEDAISRDDAIKRVSQCLKGVFVEYEDIARKMFAEDKVPSVQSKMRTGHWIKIAPSGIYMCSECEQNVLTGDIDAYHYCHHCGIKMINESEKS